ncbi:serine/threonine protein kinase, partial [Streptomyces triticirhizae]
AARGRARERERAPERAAERARGGARERTRPRPPERRRPGPSAKRRAADQRLLRQRVFVFVTVTLLVALGITLAQGCQGPL